MLAEGRCFSFVKYTLRIMIELRKKGAHHLKIYAVNTPQSQSACSGWCGEKRKPGVPEKCAERPSAQCFSRTSMLRACSADRPSTPRMLMFVYMSGCCMVRTSWNTCSNMVWKTADGSGRRLRPIVTNWRRFIISIMPVTVPFSKEHLYGFCRAHHMGDFGGIAVLYCINLTNL